MGAEHILLYSPSLQQMQKRGPDLHLAEGLNTEGSSEIQWGFFCQMERRLIVLSIKGMLGSLTFTKRLSLPSGRADQGVPACHLPRGVNQMLKMQVKSTCPPPAALRQAGALSPGPSEEDFSSHFHQPLPDICLPFCAVFTFITASFTWFPGLLFSRSPRLRPLVINTNIYPGAWVRNPFSRWNPPSDHGPLTIELHLVSTSFSPLAVVQVYTHFLLACPAYWPTS